MSRATGRQGTFLISPVGGEKVHAFLPASLPPDLPLKLDPLLGLLGEANRSLGKLEGVTTVLPETPLFLYMYIRKEALLSSQIEGTQSSLSDLLLFENDQVPGVPLDEVQEVSNYVAAMNHGLERLRSGAPISSRLIREIHEKLLQRGRGAQMQPGEYRRSQNWVGGTRPGNAVYVPPPHHMLQDLMGDLEIFINQDRSHLPVLVKAALIHLQFESIHPFLDGNGRLGRLLITFFLCMRDVLKEPILYLSLYFKTHRQEYYRLLQEVRENGTWEEWIAFFLEGVRDTSEQAAATAKSLLLLFDEDRKRIEALGRSASSALRVHHCLQTKAVLSVRTAVQDLHLSPPTVRKSFSHLIDLGIVREVTGKKRSQLFSYAKYIEILNQGTEPL